MALLAFGLTCGLGEATPLASTNFKLHPFQIDLSSRLPRMLDLVRKTRLPAQSSFISTETTAGISLGDLKSFKDEWLTSFDWKIEEKSLNK